MIRIEKLLSREIGLSAASIGSTAIEMAVRTRMQQIGTTDVDRYASELQYDAVELRALIEHIVVSETWFFRDADVFRALLQHVNDVWRKKRSGHALRVLSMPCATGEEPYSIAMTLLDGGLSPHDFRIHAFDVSQHAVEAAQRGVYGKNSFRGDPLGERKSHYQVLSTGELLALRLRSSRVTFWIEQSSQNTPNSTSSFVEMCSSTSTAKRAVKLWRTYSPGSRQTAFCSRGMRKHWTAWTRDFVDWQP